MRLRTGLLLLAGLLSGGALVSAQQGKPAAPQGPPANSQKPSSQANPFPEDTTKVPVMSNGNAPVNPEPPANVAAGAAPAADVDPVRSPDDPRPEGDTGAEGFSSSAAGLENLATPPDTDAGSGRGKKGRGAAPVAPEHQETAAEDEKVGEYYLTEKNWKAALSRYESAVVLDPENP